MVSINMTKKSRADENININVTGLAPNKKIIIRAASSDYYCINADIREFKLGDTWTSYGVFKTDDKGSIDLSKAESLAGTYTGCDQMGLFTSMQRAVKGNHELKYNLREIPENRQYTIHICVEDDGKVLAKSTHVKYFCDDSIMSKDIIESNLTARYFSSITVKLRPAVIVVSGSDGRIEKADAIAELLAMEGFSALAVSYFGLESTAESLSEIPLEIIKEAIAWLQKQESVDCSKIMIYGRSKGGEMALAAAARFPEISRIVACVPGAYVYEGLNKKMLPSKHSSWTFEGIELPYLRFTLGLSMQMGIKMLLKQKNVMPWLYHKILSRKGSDKAAIEVEKIKSPLLLISSDTDEIWTSKEQCERITERMKKHNNGHCCRHVTYSKAGHMLTIANQSIPKLKHQHRATQSWADANRDAWYETLSFLHNRNKQ